MSQRTQPIFYRLLVAFMLVGVTVSGPLIYLSFELNRQSIERRAQQNVLQQLAIIATNFNQEFATNLTRSLRATTASPNLDAFLSASDDTRLIIGKALETDFIHIANDYDSYSGLYYVDGDGKVVVSVAEKRRNALPGFAIAPAEAIESPDRSATLAAMRRLFHRIKATPLLLSSGNMEWFMPPREPQVEGSFVDEAGRLSILAALPKLDPDDGAFGGVIMIRQRLDRFLARLKSIKFFDENPIWLLGADGQILMRPENLATTFNPYRHLSPTFADTTQLLMLGEGLVAYRDLAIVAGKPFMRIAIAAPSSLLRKDLGPTVRLLLMVLAASMTVVFAIAYVVSRKFARPIVELASAASKLAAGDLSTRVKVSAEGEVKVLVDAFNKMGENLQEASAQQRRFVSVAAHEFRTPLTIIDGAAQRLKRNADRCDPRDLRERADKIRVAVARMAQLIDTTLNSARLDEGRVELNAQMLDLVALVGGVCQRLESIAEGFSIELAPARQRIEIMGDARLLDHAFTNLVSNAVKYSGTSRRIQVGITDNGERAAISVRDYGIGIPEGEIPQLFARFFRASTAKGLSGTGIGLNLVKALVTMHGGEIRVASRVGEGSVFTVELPSRVAAVTSPDQSVAAD